jgi:predicted acylesterase/phospholipase RssA
MFLDAIRRNTRWIILVGVLFQGCATLPRLDAVPAPLTEKAQVPGIPDARIWLDRDPTAFINAVMVDNEHELAALQRAGKPTNPLPPIQALVISGGGDAGAFGAGVLSGWTARGDRPEFKVVTGISVGALIAPFAFLGPKFDDVVRSVAIGIGPHDILKQRNTLTGLMSDGMASSEPLARIVEKFVTPEVLAAVAREYLKGRALHIGTTDLDAGRQVTWNMGAIAASGAPGALHLFRKIMIASTSIPGAVSPVMFDVEVDGKRYQEMHVDGGVISQLFLYPAEAFSQMKKVTGTPFTREAHIYLIRNGRLEPQWNDTKRRTLSIGGRAINSLVNTQGINDVRRLYQTVSEDHFDFNLAYIGTDFDVPHSQEFNNAYMRKLYDYAYQLTVAGHVWHKTPP